MAKRKNMLKAFIIFLIVLALALWVMSGEYTYGLRYEEFIAPMIKTIQMQQKEIDELKAQVKLLLGGKG